MARYRGMYISIEALNDIRAWTGQPLMTQEEYDFLKLNFIEEERPIVLKKTFRSIDEDWEVSKEQKSGA